MKQLAYIFVLFGVSILYGCTTNVSIPPAVIVPAKPAGTSASAIAARQSTVKKILAQSKAAMGGAAWDQVNNLRLEGTISIHGFSGDLTILNDVRTGQSVAHASIGPFQIVNGFDGQVAWSKQPNGEIVTHDTAAERKSSMTSAYMTEQAWWYPKRWPAKIELLGMARTGDNTLQVLRITPRGADPFELWINTSTHFIARFVKASGKARKVSSLSDYRSVDGVEVPFHREFEGGSSHGQVQQINKVIVNVPVSAKEFAAPNRHLNDYSFAGGGNKVTIPFQPVDNHVHFQVKINGHPLQFILDTGSTNVLSPKAAKAIGLKSGKSLQVSGAGTGGGSVKIGLAKVKAFTIENKVSLRDQGFYIIPLPSRSGSAQLDGTVGYGIFKRFVVRIDYAKQQLTLIRPSTFKPSRNTGTPVPLVFVSGYMQGLDPVVTGSLDGIEGRFWIDTGSAGTLDVFSPFAKKHDLYTRYQTTPETISGYGIGGADRSRTARAGKLMIGSVAVNNPVINLSTMGKGAYAAKGIVGNIGGGILKRFTVTFDYADNVMYLKPNQNYGKPMNYNRSGMEFRQTRQGFAVVDVMKGGPAAQAGIKAGDIITAVNGKPANKINGLEFRAKLRNEVPGSKVQLTIGDGETARTATLILRRLIPKTGGPKEQPPRHAQ